MNKRTAGRLTVTMIPALVLLFSVAASSQTPGRNYQFTPVLHSVSYVGVWRGQAQLSLDQFLVKAK